MKHKKFLAMLMALAMMFSLCVGALADDPPAGDSGSNTPSSAPVNGNTSFSGNAAVQVPTIAVSVPTTSLVFINPMGFEVKLDGTLAEAADVADEDTDTTKSKIVSPIIPILNNSPMYLSVGVIGSVAPKEGNVGLAVATAPIAPDDTKNSVFVYTLFGTPDYTPPVADNTDTTDVDETAPEKYSWPSNFTTTYNATTPAVNTLALTTKAPTVPVEVGNIAAATYTPATGDDPTADGYEAAKTTPGRFAFQFLGDCTANPKTAWSAVAGDAVTVSLAFTFKPAEPPAANNNNGNSGG